MAPTQGFELGPHLRQTSAPLTHCETLTRPIKDEVARTKPEKIVRYSLLLAIPQ